VVNKITKEQQLVLDSITNLPPRDFVKCDFSSKIKTLLNEKVKAWFNSDDYRIEQAKQNLAN
jgi:hypothetical protein